MSERGSFVTEFIYCEKCFVAIKRLLEAQGQSKYFHAQQVADRRIMAGGIGSLHDEILEFDMEYVPMIEDVICCPIRVAVLSDKGESKVFQINPYEPKVE